jgi:hypothetical protein
MSNLLLAEQFQTLKPWLEEHISELQRVNVVLHGSASGGVVRRRHRHNALYGVCESPQFQTVQEVMPHSLAHCTGTASHYRIAAGHTAAGARRKRKFQPGKFLVFSTGNLIRAGKSNHAHAVLAMYQFTIAFGRVSKLGPARWPTSLSGPNAVVSGRFRNKISEDIKNDSLTTYTEKFPGIAVRTQLHATPELYLKRSAFIISGVTSVAQLKSIFKVLVGLYEKYKLPEPAPLL